MDKNERKNMEEKWKPHPTRDNIFIDQDTGLLYERIRGWYNRIPQKMTELQELECFRKADGVVRMTSRSRGRVAPPADPAISDE
ncbi:MAG: hypothetical protein H8E38_00150 [SAR324 cluster bacterium]|nr:hypothetical protein [SAR324 cluster bacterium]